MEIVAEKVVAGGEALAREADGRVVMIEGAIPGERVEVELTTKKKSFARGHVTAVLDPSPDRVAPPCEFVAAGCGGCEWQHIAPDAQRALRRGIVVDALSRIGKVTDAEALVATGLSSRAESWIAFNAFLVRHATPTRLRVEVADDDRFARIVMSGDVEASPATDFCAHAVVEGLDGPGVVQAVTGMLATGPDALVPSPVMPLDTATLTAVHEGTPLANVTE